MLPARKTLLNLGGLTKILTEKVLKSTEISFNQNFGSVRFNLSNLSKIRPISENLGVGNLSLLSKIINQIFLFVNIFDRHATSFSSNSIYQHYKKCNFHMTPLGAVRHWVGWSDGWSVIIS